MELIGKILAGRYEIIEKVGEGGMAYVFKARDNLLNRYVAVKILKEEFSKDEVFVKRFRTEAQSAASLIHPNIVSVFDVGEDKGISYIVMELLESKTLKDYIQEKGYLILCSDGLTNMLSNEDILQTVKNVDFMILSDIFIDRANLNGGPDNITVVVVEI